MNKLMVACAMVFAIVFTEPVQAGGHPIPMTEIIDAPVAWPDGKPGELATVQAAVLRGLVDKGWVGRVVSPGVVHATLRRDDWVCEIDIPFTVTAYSIKYATSTNLDYDPATRKIHRNFNRWLVLLQQRIDANMMQAVP